MTNRIPRVAKVFYKPCYEQLRNTKFFSVEESCIGCGLCEQKCPDKTIRMQNRKPVWTKEQCIMCLGCLHRCPKFAIQYANKTKGHGQYHNPHVPF